MTAEFKKYFLVSVYVPNSGDMLQRLGYRVKEWDADFHSYIANLEVKHQKPVIVVGDFNVCHTDLDYYGPAGPMNSSTLTAEEKNSFSAFLKNAKLIDAFRYLHPNLRKYSYWSVLRKLRAKDMGLRLDYALVSESMIDSVDKAEVCG